MTSSPSTLVRTALPAALAVFLFQSWYVHGWMLDDAFIFFRYAENWVAGHGPVYNPGETVEGYTSFLWLALLTLGHACGANVVVLSQVLGYVAALACLLMVHQSHRFLRSVDRSASALATVFLASSAAFAVWAGSGMETSLSALLILATVLAHIRALEQDYSPRRWAGVGLLCALCTMNRPDALLVLMVFLMDLAWRRQQGQQGQDSYRAFRMLLGTFVLVFGAYYAWRFAYYGYPLPNTFYVRVGSTWSQVVRGLLYLGLFLIAALPLVVSCFLPGPQGYGRADRNYLVVPALLLVHTCYVILVGGDAMPAFRFFTPVMPLLCLLAGMAVGVVRRPALRTGVAWTVAVCTLAFGFLHQFVIPAVRKDMVVYIGRVTGNWLRENAAPDALLATNTAGSVAYYSRLWTIDMLGLNDVHIAHREIPTMGEGLPGHEKWDGKYVVSRQPDFIQFGSSAGTIKPESAGGREIMALPEFQKNYKLRVVIQEIVLPSGGTLGGFVFYERQLRQPR